MPNPILVGQIGWIAGDKNTGEARIKLDNSSQAVFNTQALKLDGKKIKVIVSTLTKKKMRSVEQNNYYWGVVLEIIAEYLGYIGPGEKEDLHNELRSMFLVRMGKLGSPVVESTTKLSTKIFEKYLEAVRTFMLNNYGIKIPLPNEVEEADESDTYRKL
jgi:cell division protein FtsI/penicillin-binding protein 2